MCVIVDDVSNALGRLRVTVRVRTCMPTHQYYSRSMDMPEGSLQTPQHPPQSNP